MIHVTKNSDNIFKLADGHNRTEAINRIYDDKKYELKNKLIALRILNDKYHIETYGDLNNQKSHTLANKLKRNDYALTNYIESFIPFFKEIDLKLRNSWRKALASIILKLAYNERNADATKAKQYDYLLKKISNETNIEEFNKKYKLSEENEIILKKGIFYYKKLIDNTILLNGNDKSLITSEEKGIIYNGSHFCYIVSDAMRDEPF